MLNSIRSQYETTDHHGGTQHLVHLRAERRPMPSQKTLDAAADFALTGGWNVAKGNICDDCHEARSVNGNCGC
jgi:hypothetical protein